MIGSFGAQVHLKELNSKYLHNIYYVPSTLLRTSQIFTHRNLTNAYTTPANFSYLFGGLFHSIKIVCFFHFPPAKDKENIASE